MPGRGIDRSETARELISKVKEKIKSKAAKVFNKIANVRNRSIFLTLAPCLVSSFHFSFPNHLPHFIL